MIDTIHSFATDIKLK